MALFDFLHAVIGFLVLFTRLIPGRSDDFPVVEHCSVEQGGGVCPFGNTCCPMMKDGTGSGCIPSDLGARFATCCGDRVSGCGVGYGCSADRRCVATAAISDPLVQVLPRYPLCRVGTHSNVTQIHGLAVPTVTGQSQNLNLLYYSSHGALESIPKNSIQQVLIVVHGASRNAGDYFCAATAAVLLQNQTKVERVLVLAPRFAVPKDVPESLRHTTLLWEDVPNGSWRYGASALNTTVGSLDAMDQLVQRIRKLLGSVPTITLAGHSSGGQFVQRWALLSPVGMQIQAAVVANPSSFAYLIPERYDANSRRWIRPDTRPCPGYDQWEWGLEWNVDTPQYVQTVFQAFYNASDSSPYRKLIERFAQRRVVYMAGSLDRCNVSSSATPSSTESEWCESHGLETTCMDQLQGTNRWERNERYMAMLKRVGVVHHRQVVVPGVGHDHSLMWSSPEGLDILFSLGEEEGNAAPM